MTTANSSPNTTTYTIAVGTTGSGTSANTTHSACTSSSPIAYVIAVARRAGSCRATRSHSEIIDNRITT